ncbi:GldG family protein [Sphingobium sp. BYY-5]|uniref:GldG family protein n=1 Tax=Sphingobium sp. BYY-5 TaxID=2926400 RepID=UPI001FA6DC4E|nr:GldG family protein [Sphingobium sp. BYY-5]MCI4590061.1 GldG family protein [Sphingobium sp. BYY-5]
MAKGRGMVAIVAALKRFLWLWLPMLAALLAGLSRAWRTGQADPWDWGVATAVVLAVVGLLLARRSWAVWTWVAVGAAGSALIFCALAAARMPDIPAGLGLSVVALLAVFGGAWVRHALLGRIAGAFLLALAGLLLWRGPAQPVTPVPGRPKLAVITGLPLFWAEPGGGGAALRDAPIIAVLRTRFTVEPIDDPLRLARSDVRRLLVAQPRALAPQQLVALDHWVRMGGTALVLADPLLCWPSALPLGDRRRVPSASLLAPLLAHWGFTPGSLVAGEIRHFLPDGHLVTLSDAGLFSPADALPLRKRIGRGEVLLLGDADLIDDRLWLADPARPLDPRAWVADTPALVSHWLGASIPGERHWMRAPADVIAGLRWAILAGTGWAILGAMLLHAQFVAKKSGTKSENKPKRSQKSSSTHF